VLGTGGQRPGANPIYETADSQLSNPTGQDYGSESARPEAPAEDVEVRGGACARPLMGEREREIDFSTPFDPWKFLGGWGPS
jgi:hypothetical protein